MKLYLIRHGESANNVIYSTTGGNGGRVADPDLTETGHQQAQLLAQHLADPLGDPQQHPWAIRDGGHRGHDLTHVYCSLMARSILTAQYIAEACNLPLLADADIFEKDGVYDEAADGTRTGLPGPDRAYFQEKYPNLKLPATLGKGGWYNRPAETEEQFLRRSKQVVLDINRRHADTNDRVALLIHGDLIDQLVNELMGIERHPENYTNHWVANWAFHNTSITRIDVTAGSRVIVYMNRLQHIPADLVTW